MGKGLIQTLTRQLVDDGRLPGAYQWENDGWVHCRCCDVGAMWPGDLPAHAAACDVAAEEAARKGAMGEDQKEHIEQFFAYAHLPAHLQEVSRPFSELAQAILRLPRNPERTVALRKLLESKDAAVRAALAK